MVHPSLQALADATRDTSFEGRIWLVGGALRDELLGLPVPNDFDVVVEGDAVSLAEHCRQMRISEIEPVVYPRFGTALVRVQGSNIEMASARKESYSAESRKPNVEQATLLEDARRRDFTVNTLLLSLHSGEMLDPLGSAKDDLASKVLKTPLDPKATFSDDPLRMLRAVRFAHKLGFMLAPGLLEAMRLEAGRLAIISAERIRDELAKMLIDPSAPDALRMLEETGLLSLFARELSVMKGVLQGSYHHLDVWDHTLLVVEWTHKLNSGWSDERTLRLILAALLHDVGKPGTRFVDQAGDIRFFGHEVVGSEISEKLLRSLKFSSAQIDPVVLLVRNHMRLGSMSVFTEPAARRVLRDLGPFVEDLLVLVDADARSLRPGVKAINLESIRSMLHRVREASPAESWESPLSGEEIMSLTGLTPGPKIGEIKRLLVERVLDGVLAPDDVVAARRIVREVSL